VDVGNGDDTTAGVDDPAVLALVGAVGLTEPHATRRTDATAMPNFIIERIKPRGLIRRAKTARAMPCGVLDFCGKHG
jgi:hypothetical protein